MRRERAVLGRSPEQREGPRQVEGQPILGKTVRAEEPFELREPHDGSDLRACVHVDVDGTEQQSLHERQIVRLLDVFTPCILSN